MLKRLLIVLIACLATVAIAETDYIAKEYFDGKRTAADFKADRLTALVSVTAPDLTLTDDASVAGSLTVTGSASIGSLLALTSGSIALTGTGTISPVTSIVNLNPPMTSSTNTFALPYTVGDIAILVVSATNTATATITDSTTATGFTNTLGATDVLAVYFTATNKLVKLFLSDN